MTTAIDHSTYFTTLPRDYYFSQEVYDREVARIFERQWLYFCHVSELAKPGSYVARERGGENVIVTRTSEGKLSAMRNFCRHRGARLCPPGTGEAKRIVCPYHQWTYGLDGKLVNAPTIPNNESIDYSQWGLHQLQVDVWHGFVFIGLGSEPLEPLSTLFADCEDEFKPLQAERLKQVHVDTYEIKANWKVVIENYVECYHCLATHPELSRVIDPRAQIVRPGDDLGPDAFHFPTFKYGKINQKLRDGAQSLTHDGNYSSTKLLGDFGEGTTPPVGWSMGAIVQPAVTQILFFADHGTVGEIIPLSVDRTLLVNRFFVHEDAEKDVDYNHEALTGVWDATYSQDVDLCEWSYEGMRSKAYAPGPLSAAAEPHVRSILGAYLDLMSED
ncbi:aromatic ring-hydroxylating oxygenase subunit alpha [Nocardia pseudovaccinii]|uniref:aromatic ring-hydroxylating oxygenase subunit alpha n=1 Tax=Nocardia pseudovaccinii TaxID=189540 RepID=UPI003D8A39EB